MARLRHSIAFGFILMAMLMALPAFAQPVLKQRWSPAREEISGARTLGMGRAFIAIAEGNAAAWYNPAGVAQRPLYKIDISGEFNPNGEAYSTGISVVDSITTVVAAHVGYTFNGYDSQQLWRQGNFHNYITGYGALNLEQPGQAPGPVGWAEDWVQNSDYSEDDAGKSSWEWYQEEFQNGSYDTYLDSYIDPENYPKNPPRMLMGKFRDGDIYRHVARLALAGAITKNFMLGVSGKYTWAERPMRHTVNAGNVDIGLLVKTDFGLNVGATAYNLIHTAYDMWPLKFGAGLAYTIYDELYVDFDTILVLDSYQEKNDPRGYYRYKEGVNTDFRGGIEYVAGGIVPLRLGYEYDQMIGNQYVSAGAAYKGDMFSVNAAFSQGIQDTEDRLISLTIDFLIE